MNRWLGNFIRSLLSSFWPARNGNSGPPGPQQPNAPVGNARRIPRGHERRNPAMEALREIFAPRHAAEEQVVFTAIPRDGIVVEKSEEWYRDGNAMKTVSKQSVVITCSGEVVSPTRIKAKCASCGGFDAHFARCSHPECGVALCRLHQRVFTGGVVAVVLCDRHYREAIHLLDTWAAFDRANPGTKRRA